MAAPLALLVDGRLQVLAGVIVPEQEHAGYFQPEVDDPLDEPGHRALIGQLGAQGGRVRADGDRAVVEFGAHSGAGLPGDSDLVSS
jgi:hypothetical protein